MSVYRSNKRPPHIVFLVDTLPFLLSNTLDETSVTSLQAMIARILLYYVDMVDDRITWGFRFFNTNNASITMSNRRFLPVSTHSIHEFVKELHDKVEHERTKLATEAKRSTEQRNEKATKHGTDSCFSNLKQTLMQTLAEFQWKDIDLLGASPRSQRIRNSAKSGHHHQDQLLPIKNYIYVISPRPHSMVDLKHYMDSCYGKKSVQTKLTSKDDKVDTLACIQRMADELKRWLWDDYANHQISINWIDREITKTHKEMDMLIQTGFESIMQMFGGHLITENMLKHDYNYWGLSFGTIFDHYRSLHMNSSPELLLPMMPDQQAKKLISPEERNNQTDTPIWSGPLITKSNTQSHLRVNAGSLKRLDSTIQKTTLQSSTPVDHLPTTLFDGIESMEVVELLYADEIKVEWLQHVDEVAHTLWSSSDEFSAIITLLQERQMVLIVRLCPSSNDNAKLGLVEPVFDGCAFISPLPGSTFSFTSTCDSARGDIQPLGSNITDFLELSSVPTISHELDTTRLEADMNSSMAPPPCVNVLLEKFSRSSINNISPPLDKTPMIIKPKEPSARSMPATIEEFTVAIQDLYLDTLYTIKHTLLDSMTILLSYIDHISSLAKQNKFEISPVVASLQSMTMLSSEFDDKHRIKIPAMMKMGMDDGNEQEILCFMTWLADVRAKCGRNTDHEELSFKALKIKDAKMQVIFLLATIQMIKEGRGDKEQDKKPVANRKKRRDRQDIGQTNLASENPEDQLEIYFDRMFIWEQVSNVVGFLQERDAEAAEHSTKRLDPADIYIHHFCGHLEKCFAKKLPTQIGKLWEKVDKDDDKDDFDETFPTPNKRRKTLLEMRMRGDSPGETTTAHWITPPNGDSQESTSSSKSRYQPRTEPTPSGASKRKQSMFPILPFMKREIIMSKVVNSKAKQPVVEPSDNKPSFRRTGSFTKSVTSPKRRIVKRKTTTETNTVVLRKRAPNSPTTPRTRLAREFGVSMTPRPSSSSGSINTTNTDNSSDYLQPSNSLVASLLSRSPHRPRSTREFGIAVSPARSAARKIIGYKSPRTHRTGSARELLHGIDEGEVADGPRDLTNALLAARSPTKNEYRANSDVRKTFRSLFDD